MSVYFYQTGRDKELVFVEDKTSLPSEGEVNKLYVVRKNELGKGAIYLWNVTQNQYESIGGGIAIGTQGYIEFKKVEW